MPVRTAFLATINADHPQTGIIRAFNGILGAQNVVHYDFMQRLRDSNWGVEMVNGEFLDSIVAFRPDLAFLQLQDTSIIRTETIAKAMRKLPSTLFVKWQGDVRTEPSEYVRAMAKQVDMTCIASKGQLDLYRSFGARDVRYLQIGLDWDEDVLGSPEWNPPFHVTDCVFIGNNYKNTFPGTSEREAMVRSLTAAGVPVSVVGSGWEETGLPIAGQCGVKQQVRVYRKAKVALSVNHFPDLAGYYSDRHLCALASGTPLVCRYIPRLEDEFKNGEHLLWYRTEEELVSAVRSLLSDDGERRRIGENGREEVLRNHTWYSRILALIAWADRDLGGLR